jgi:diacylglycerol kinase (ATP)
VTCRLNIDDRARDTFRRVIESPYKGETGIRRVISAARNSFAGIAEAVRHEDAFRQELILAAILVPLAFWVGRSGVERALLVGSVLLVLIVELLNSAIEATVDRISYENHRLAKRAKDIGSAAVMLALILAGSTWLLVLIG